MLCLEWLTGTAWSVLIHCFAMFLTGHLDTLLFFFFPKHSWPPITNKKQQQYTPIHALWKRWLRVAQRGCLGSFSAVRRPLSAGLGPAGSALRPRCLTHRNFSERGSRDNIGKTQFFKLYVVCGEDPPLLLYWMALYSQAWSTRSPRWLASLPAMHHGVCQGCAHYCLFVCLFFPLSCPHVSCAYGRVKKYWELTRGLDLVPSTANGWAHTKVPKQKDDSFLLVLQNDK